MLRTTRHLLHLMCCSSFGLCCSVLAHFLEATQEAQKTNRTVAYVDMSCCVCDSLYQHVFSGPYITLFSIGKYLKFVKGNILQFAPLSCVHSQLQPDPFLKFFLAVGVYILVVSFNILVYLFVKKTQQQQKKIFRCQKAMKISSLRKSCYRTMFLFLPLSYPMTSNFNLLST